MYYYRRPKPPVRHPWQYEHPATARQRATILERFYEEALDAPAAVHGVLVPRIPTKGQDAEWLVFTSDTWPTSPRDTIKRGDGVMGVRPKTFPPSGKRQGRVRWHGVVLEVLAWCHGVRHEPASPRASRQHAQEIPREVLEILEACKGHDTAFDPRAEVIFVYRVQILTEGVLGEVVIPKKYAHAWPL